MNTIDQIPAIDAAVSKIDKRIARAVWRKAKLEDDRRCIDRKLDRLTRYLRELGRRRSVVATFELEL